MGEKVLSQAQNEYHSYLLRLWRPQGESWRVQIECVVSGKRHNFSDLETFVEFIENNVLEEKKLS